jgi:hypothetical protein
MKNRIEVMQILARSGGSSFLSSAKASEVFRCERHDVFEKLHLHSSRGLSLDLNVEINARI